MEQVSIEKAKGSNMLSYVSIVLVIFLLLFSAAQAFQISDLKNDLRDGNVVTARVTSNIKQTQQQAQAQAPTMVGSC